MLVKYRGDSRLFRNGATREGRLSDPLPCSSLSRCDCPAGVRLVCGPDNETPIALPLQNLLFYVTRSFFCFSPPRSCPMSRLKFCRPQTRRYFRGPSFSECDVLFRLLEVPLGWVGHGLCSRGRGPDAGHGARGVRLHPHRGPPPGRGRGVDGGMSERYGGGVWNPDSF